MANRYWVGGTGTWTVSSTTNWSATSGGASGASAPTSADSVFFDQAATYTVTKASVPCLDLTVSAGVVTISGSGEISVSGSVNVIAATVFASGAGLTFVSTVTGKTINISSTNTSTLDLTFNGAAGGWILTANLTARAIIVTRGTFNSGSFAINLATLTSPNSQTRAITLGTSTVTLSSTVIPLSLGNFALTYSGASATLIFSGIGPTIDTGGNRVFGAVSFTGAPTSNITFQDAGDTFASLNFPAATSLGSVATIELPNMTVTGALTISGSASIVYRYFIKSRTYGTVASISVGTFNITNPDFQDNTIVGEAAPVNGVTRILGNCGNNSGITFSAAKTVYWNLTGSSAWTATAWATTSGGTRAIANFPLAQDTCVFDNTGLATTVNQSNALVGTVSAGSRTTAINLNLGGYIFGDVTLGSGVTLGGSTGVVFSGSSSRSITSAGKIFPDLVNFALRLNSILTLVDNFVALGDITFSYGQLNLNNKTLTCPYISINSQGTKTLAFGTGSITINNNFTGDNTLYVDYDVLTTTGTPVVNFTYGGASTMLLSLEGVQVAPEIEAWSLNFTAGTYSVNFTQNGSNVATYFKSVNFTGYAGSWTTSFTSLVFYGDLTLSTGMAVTTVAANTLYFSATSGTQLITSNGKTISRKVTKENEGIMQCVDAFTVGTNAFTFTGGTLRLASSATSVVGSFTTTGTTMKYLDSTIPGTQATISDPSGSNIVTYLTYQDSNATGGAVWDASSPRNLSGGNNTGWIPPVLFQGDFLLVFVP